MNLRLTIGILILLTGALAGCGGDEPAAADERALVFRGRAVHGHEVRTFQPCGADTVLWVVDPLGLLWDHHQALAPPGTPLFAVVAGERGPAPTEGFGADYAGTLKVDFLLYIGIEGPDCDFAWDAFEFRALGNEPSWAADLLADGLHLTRPGHPDLHWPEVTREDGPGHLRVFAAGGADRPPVDLRLELRLRRDTMSEAVFGISAELIIDGECHQGHALWGQAVARP